MYFYKPILFPEPAPTFFVIYIFHIPPLPSFWRALINIFYSKDVHLEIVVEIFGLSKAGFHSSSDSDSGGGGAGFFFL